MLCVFFCMECGELVKQTVLKWREDISVLKGYCPHCGGFALYKDWVGAGDCVFYRSGALQ